MKLRDTYIRKGYSIPDTGTEIVPINVDEPITALFINIKATTGATSCQDHSLIDDISKIEIVDGSDVIYSMNGALARALAYWVSGKMGYGLYDEGAGVTQEFTIPIYFGRWIGDTEYYLDPKDFRNLQLKITVALTISATAGFATGTGQIDVIATLFSEQPEAKRGFLMSKDVYSFTTVASGDETVSLPVDFPYRLVMVRAFESGTALETDLTNLKLTCNNDSFIPFDVAMVM